MQHGYSEGHLKQPRQIGFCTAFEDSIKAGKDDHMAPERTHIDKTASAQEGVQEASRQVSTGCLSCKLPPDMLKPV